MEKKRDQNQEISSIVTRKACRWSQTILNHFKSCLDSGKDDVWNVDKVVWILGGEAKGENKP